jgi:hypothetical protein
VHLRGGDAEAGRGHRGDAERANDHAGSIFVLS